MRWGSWGEAASGEEHAETVVVAVAEPSGEAAVVFDDPVGRAVARQTMGQGCSLSPGRRV